MAAITLHNVTLGYQRHPAVHHLSGSFASGSMTAIVGPNGSGKSTLLKGITGFLRPMEGSIDRGGLQAHQIAYLPQRLEVDRSFPITVLDTVLLGLWQEIGMFGGVDSKLEKMIAKRDGAGIAKLLGAKDAQTRKKAISALGRAGGEEAYNHLTTLIRDPDADTRKAAAEALVALNDPKSKAHIAHQLDRETDAGARAALGKALGAIAEKY